MEEKDLNDLRMETAKRVLNELLTTLFPGHVALFISESCGGLLKIVEIGPENWRNLTLDDLCELTFDLI